MEPAPEAASLRTKPRTGDAVKRLPTTAQELRLTLHPRIRAPPSSRSFLDDQGAAILLRADPQLSSGTARIGGKEITGIDKGPARPPHLPRPLRRRNLHQSSPGHHPPLLPADNNGACSGHHPRRQLAAHPAASLVAQKHLVNAGEPQDGHRAIAEFLACLFSNGFRYTGNRTYPAIGERSLVGRYPCPAKSNGMRFLRVSPFVRHF